MSPIRQCLVTAVLAALATGAVQAQNVTPIQSGRSITGQLDERSPKEADNTAYALYGYRGTPGERILVELKSSDFDAYLTIGGSGTAQGCEDCRRNDDGGTGTDSRLRYTLPASGQVQIRAGMVDPSQSGRYSLHLSTLPPAAPARPQALAIGRETSGRLGEQAPLDDNDRPYDLWTLQGQPQQSLVLRMDAENMDSMLRFGRMIDGQFVQESEDDDGGRGLNARLRVTLDDAGHGAVQATSPDATASGTYRISATVPPRPQPIRVTDLNIGDSLQGKLEEGDSFTEDKEILYDIYRIKGRPGQRVMVQVGSDEFDTLLRWGVLDGGRFIQDAEDDDSGGGTNSRMTVTLDADGQGRLMITSAGEGNGRYTLSAVNAPRGR
ncbi:hypothetical protein EBB59_12465 [Lysobacter pythonis]|uniref:Uncharacterized protein n=1 Tax=Solilutibacter pythonis TaxID=2483112 RepID=A0A3M2HDQ3_9GAMM|nr:hypothetical protein [Lysobacter pythonis]RMH87886.1 hypothetical protein EBB59_12465 [Lysobacter pythonis]